MCTVGSEKMKKGSRDNGEGSFLFPLAPYVPLSHKKLIKNYREQIINLMALLASLEIPPMHKKPVKVYMSNKVIIITVSGTKEQYT